MEILIVDKSAFQLVGLTWQGTFEQAGAGEIRQVMQKVRERQEQILNRIDPSTILGITQSMTQTSFTYTVGFEVEHVDQIPLPEGMSHITVPAQLYAKAIHPTAEEVFQSYQRVFEWIKLQGYQQVDQHMNHLELYPVTYNPLTDTPELTIMIPIQKE